MGASGASFGLEKPEKGHFSLPRIPSNKLKQFNNPRKNPILTLTSLNAQQYQNQGGNGVGVAQDWKLKLKPPTHLDGYIESPQVYKVNTLKQDGDQSVGDYLHHQKNDQGLSPEGLSPEELSSEGLSSDGLSSEGLSSEGLSSEGLSSEGLSSEGLSSEGASSVGLSSEGLSSEGLSSVGSVNARTLHGASMQSIPNKSTLDSVEQLLKNDNSHLASAVTGDSARALSQPGIYNKVMKQDLSDIESALGHQDDSITHGDGLTGLGSQEIPEVRMGGIRDLEKGTALGLPDLEQIPSHDGLPRGGVSRAIIPDDPLNNYKEDEMSDVHGGRFVPLDKVINDLRTDLRNH